MTCPLILDLSYSKNYCLKPIIPPRAHPNNCCKPNTDNPSYHHYLHKQTDKGACYSSHTGYEFFNI